MTYSHKIWLALWFLCICCTFSVRVPPGKVGTLMPAPLGQPVKFPPVPEDAQPSTKPSVLEQSTEIVVPRHRNPHLKRLIATGRRPAPHELSDADDLRSVLEGEEHSEL